MTHNSSSEYYSSCALPPVLPAIQNPAMAKTKKRIKAAIFFREWRKHRHLTQDQVAEKSGLSQGSIAKIERGEIAITQNNLQALARAYDCEISELLRPPTGLSELGAYIQGMDEKDQARALKVLKALGNEDDNK